MAGWSTLRHCPALSESYVVAVLIHLLHVCTTPCLVLQPAGNFYDHERLLPASSPSCSCHPQCRPRPVLCSLHQTLYSGLLKACSVQPTGKQALLDSCACLQDAQAASAVGDMSYNKLLDTLVGIMGDATPKALLGSHSQRRLSAASSASVRLNSSASCQSCSDALFSLASACPVLIRAHLRRCCRPLS